MSAVVVICRKCLTVGTEVRIMADSALIADTFNVCRDVLVLAKGSITEDAIVANSSGDGLGQRIINWHKAVAGVCRLGIFDTACAEVPIRAVQALVADAVDELLMLVTCYS